MPAQSPREPVRDPPAASAFARPQPPEPRHAQPPPSPRRRVEVRIGTIELRFAEPAPVAPVAPVAPAASGLDEYATRRAYRSGDEL